MVYPFVLYRTIVLHLEMIIFFLIIADNVYNRDHYQGHRRHITSKFLFCFIISLFVRWAPCVWMLFLSTMVPICRWEPRTCCARINRKKIFLEKKKKTWPLTRSNNMAFTDQITEISPITCAPIPELPSIIHKYTSFNAEMVHREKIIWWDLASTIFHRFFKGKPHKKSILVVGPPRGGWAGPLRKKTFLELEKIWRKKIWLLNLSGG